MTENEDAPTEDNAFNEPKSGSSVKLNPLTPAQIETIRRQNTNVENTSETNVKEALKDASHRLKVAQMEAETKRVKQGEGTLTTGEIARDIAGAFAGLARVFASAFKFVSGMPRLSVAIACLAVLLFETTFGGLITHSAKKIGSTVSDLLSTYISQPAERNANKKPASINKTSLKTAVSIGELTDASTSYAGIAVKTNDKQEAVCHIYYETTVNAYVDTSAIDFDVDDENKTITPILPEQQLNVETPSTGSITYFEDNPDISSDEALRICSKDAKNDAADNNALATCGEANLKKTIEALLNPILTESEYTLSW